MGTIVRSTRGKFGLAAAALGVVAMTLATAHARLPDDRPPEEPEPAPATKPEAPPVEPAPAAPSMPPKPGVPGGPGGPSTPPGRGPAAGSMNSMAPAIAWPHPIISEVLYAVPTGPEGDASGDGVRDVSGDEFVELYNPHSRPIQLRGYAIADTAGRVPRGGSGGGGGVKFVFPAVEVAAGGVVVVFNGRNTNLAGPVGDARLAPSGPSERFGGALVFSMKQTSQRASFSNTLDSVCLIGPDGTLLHRVRWGKLKDGAAEPAGTAAALDETVPTVSKCSAVRDGAGPGSVWRPHLELGGSAFSPGTVPMAPPQAEPGTKPAPEPGSKRPAPGSRPKAPPVRKD